jgi:tetratricopeptide (TPR) repeat protein
MNHTAPETPHARRWEHVVIALLAVGFIAAGLARLNDLSLYTDSTRYLIWANSLAQGNGFLDSTTPEPTRFVMNAPLYPVLLVPSQLAWPWSLDAAKIWTLLWGAAAVVLFFYWMRRSFGPLSSLASAAFLALHPLFFVVSSEVLSEAPFMALLLVVLLTIEPLVQSKAGSRWAFLAAALLVLLPLVREVAFAFALAAAIVLAHAGRLRKAGLILGGAALVIVAWNIRNAFFLPELQAGQEANIQFLFGHFVTPQGESLLNEFVTRIWLNARGYLWTIAGGVFHPFPSNLVHEPSALYTLLEGGLGVAKLVVLLGALALALHGVLLDIEKAGTGLFRPLAVLLFGLIVLVYPVHELRFVLPILPLLVYFIVRSLTDLGRRFIPQGTLRQGAGFALASLVMFPNALALTELVRTNARYQDNPESFARQVLDSGDASAFYTRPWEHMGAWIVDHVAQGSVIASPAKEIASYVPDRAVLELSRSVPGPLFDRSLRDYAVEYLLATTVWADFRSYEFAMTESRRFRFEPLHSTGALTLFRVRREPWASAQAVGVSEADTTAYDAPALLRRGRRHLLRLEYIEALGTLAEAARLAPLQAEITAQQIFGLSVVGDVERSRALFEQLFTMPQSTAHISLARSHLALAEQLQIAFEATTSTERSGRAIAAGRGYWDLGYGALALRVMQNALRLDSTSFDAALWACHFARQNADTLLSRRYLAMLKEIDVTAPIITDMSAIDEAGAALARTVTPSERVGLLLRLADRYEKLELIEEALDDLERAQAIAPGDARVRLAMTRIFEHKGASGGLRRLHTP